MMAVLPMFPLATPSPPTLHIEGTVTSSRGGVALAHCHLVLTPAKTVTDSGEQSGLQMGRRGGRGFDGGGLVPSFIPDDQYAVGAAGDIGPGRRATQTTGRSGGERITSETDAQGHFSLTVPYFGAWRLVGSARGYTTAGYQQHEGFSTALVLSAQSPNLHVTLQLQPAAALRGFVLDGTGDPVENGQVQVQRKQETDYVGAAPRWTVASFAQTDDRGHYEVSGLAEGTYRVAVSAQPWYASRLAGMASTAASSPDPSLDLVYPLTWFPGTTEERTADPLVLRAGDVREADLRLQAIAATHLSLPGVQAGISDPDGRRNRAGAAPQIVRQGVGPGLVGQSLSTLRDGNWDVGGLAPGTYEVRVPQPGGAQQAYQLIVSGGGQTSLTLGAAMPLVRVKVQVSGSDASELRSLTLTDVATGIAFSDTGPGGGFRGFGGGVLRRNGRTDQEDGQPARFVEVPDGEYIISATLSPGTTLGALSTTGAESQGRTLRITGGSPVLTLKLQHGRATVRGLATAASRPVGGAMVLLVPASFGAPGSFAVLRRAQTATDGSYQFTFVPPGPYLAVALQSGWTANWRDPGTLASLLEKAVPLEVTEAGTIEQHLEATP